MHHMHSTGLGHELALAAQADQLTAAAARRPARELATARRAAPSDSPSSRSRVRAASARLIRRPAV